MVYRLQFKKSGSFLGNPVFFVKISVFFLHISELLLSLQVMFNPKMIHSSSRNMVREKWRHRPTKVFAKQRE